MILKGSTLRAIYCTGRDQPTAESISKRNAPGGASDSDFGGSVIIWLRRIFLVATNSLDRVVTLPARESLASAHSL